MIILYTALPILFLLRLVYNAYRSGLRKIPGPFLASISDLWRARQVYNHRMPQESLRLHRKHGTLVRIGPNMVSCSSSEAVHVIYRSGTKFVKSGIYGMLQPQLDGRDLHNLFSTQDLKFHAILKRHLSGLYTEKGVKKVEPNVDRTVNTFVNKLRSIAAGPNPVIDMSQWLQWWAFDTIAEVNMSKTLGFIERGEDVDHLCEMSHHNMRYFGFMSQLQSLEEIYRRINIAIYGRPVDPLFKLVLETVKSRREKPMLDKHDRLEDFLNANESEPEEFSERDVISAIYITLVVAHDVMAITLRAVVYHLAKNPRIYAKFRNEIAEADKRSAFTNPVQLHETEPLEYVNAVIYEALRIHPPTGLILERVVPEDGVEIDGTHIPGGTVVGVNSWVFNRDESIFGQDSETFKPERWLERSESEVKNMHKWLITFSLGSRTCIGKHLAMLELIKVIVELYRHFDLKLANPDFTWDFDGSWLTAQHELNINVTTIDKK